MIIFDRNFIDQFIGVVRKYMHIRGDLSQKDLAEKTGLGISTLSRFLNQKTKDIDPQVVAKIVAGLDIPLHEIIDFIEEDSTEKFRKLVAFYKDEAQVTEIYSSIQSDPKSETQEKHSVSVGVGRRKTNVTFSQGNADKTVGEASREGTSLRDKFAVLSPRQKAYLTDFLDLDAEGKDLLVDIGNQLLRYFKQKRVEF